MNKEAEMWDALRCLPDAVEHLIHGDPDDESSVKASDAVEWAIREIARLRESLAIYVHAHATGNSVPPHIEEQASALVKEVGK